MRLLHTSDWHLGRALYGKKRYEEFGDFLSWLNQTIQHNNINALLIAGDIFDNSVPGNRAQELYYCFLHQVASSACRHVIVVAGNHDSPSFLNAPKELLKALDVHVIGGVCEDPADEVLVLCDALGTAELIVCAVPYLRDRDIRVAEAGESIKDKERKLLDGIRSHYAAVGDIAEQNRGELGADIPIVGMGHLFTAGGRTIEGDGVRDLYVGSLAHVAPGIFPECFDYVALGHLHVPQIVGGSETIRYCGSPLPMGFGEAGDRKIVCQIEFDGTAATVEKIDVPVFQKLERISGDWGDISGRILELSAAGWQGWVEVIYEGAEIIGDLRERIDSAVADSQIEILRIKNRRVNDPVMNAIHEQETLDNLSENEVFERCLAAHGVTDAQRDELTHTYQETLMSLLDGDLQAE
ncbi:MAG: exonuclease SbcCD subunit D C-terminal domain-containing protein [Gammaproteobacteria bacterium]|nr:exonuclease SbcCD subunit D C-terminal domain-containing protein [Gammaproteobacteria bacterium]